MNNQFTHPKERIRFAILTFFFAQGLCMASWASRIPDFIYDPCRKICCDPLGWLSCFKVRKPEHGTGQYLVIRFISALHWAGP